MSDRWDRHFLDMALLNARMSKDPSTKVGAPDWGAVIGGKRRTRHVVWRPGNWLLAIHRFVTLVPKIHWEPHWRSAWWLWFEVSRADEKRYAARIQKTPHTEPQ